MWGEAVRIEGLELISFRNYTRLALSLPGSLHLFLGGNGQGKTNLLEAIYLVATGRSMRAGRDEEMIRWGAPQAEVRLEAESLRGRYELQVVLTPRGKRAYVNGNWVRRLGELLEYLSAVLFVPDDLHLVKGGPEARRRYLDGQLVQALPRTGRPWPSSSGSCASGTGSWTGSGKGRVQRGAWRSGMPPSWRRRAG